MCSSCLPLVASAAVVIAATPIAPIPTDYAIATSIVTVGAATVLLAPLVGIGALALVAACVAFAPNRVTTKCRSLPITIEVTQ